MSLGSLSAADITAICTVIISFTTAIGSFYQYQRRRRFEQSENVSVWEGTRHHPNNPDNHVQMTFIANNSRSPIFDVAISYGVNYGRGRAYSTGNNNQVFVAVVPPGTYVTALPPIPEAIKDKKLGLSISFRDTRGTYWRRDATGILHLTKRPWQELGVKRPFDNWAEIERA